MDNPPTKNKLMYSKQMYMNFGTFSVTDFSLFTVTSLTHTTCLELSGRAPRQLELSVGAHVFRNVNTQTIVFKCYLKHRQWGVLSNLSVIATVSSLPIRDYIHVIIDCFAIHEACLHAPYLHTVTHIHGAGSSLTDALSCLQRACYHVYNLTWTTGFVIAHLHCLHVSCIQYLKV